MGIKNLPSRLNAAGNIKIGMKGEEVTSEGGVKFRPPTRLDHFVITTTDKTESGDFVLDTVLMDKIKASGRGVVNAAGDLIGIPVRLLYEDTDLNFPTRYASYVSGKLSCTGDGEKSTKRLDDFKVNHPCPCPRLDAEYTGKDKCKANGKLTVVIDEASLFGQAHVFRTTSINSVTGILGGIELIRTATKGHIAGLPLMLVVNNKSTTVPVIGTATTVQVVSLCYRGDMMALRQETIKLLKEDQQFLIGMDELQKEAYAMGQNIVVTEEEEPDFIDEFMPDARGEAPMVQKTVIDCKPEPEPEPEVKKETPEIEKPVNDLLFDRIVNCDDIDLSISLIQQLPKAGVVQYLKTFFQETKFKETDAKAVLVALAIELTKELFTVMKETPENTDAPVVEHEEKKMADPVEQNPETQPETTTYSWDDGPAITREQKIEIVHLKKDEFEKNVDNHEIEWIKLVGMFLNKEGQPLRSAVDLTHAQAVIFIKLVNEFLTGQIPF